MRQPNIVFILSDQHNTSPLADTPTIDQLKKSGVDFRETYCSSPLCVPSRSSIMTGKLPSRTGIWNNVQGLKDTDTTVASLLQKAGYETILSGRMHFILEDQCHGYEKHLVGEITPTYPRPERQKSVYSFLAGTPDQSMVSIKKAGKGVSAVHSYDQDVKAATLAFLKERKDDCPLFLTVGFYSPHCPFVAREDLYDKYYARLEGIKASKEYAKLHPEMQRFIDLRGIKDVTDEELRRVCAAYYANVEAMDGHIGEILATVDETLGLENTVVVYASDHGESLGAHGLFWKSNFYRESVNVPMVFSWKDHFAPRAIDAPVSLLDLTPTFLDLAGITSGIELDGKSLLPELRGGCPDTERTIVSMLSDLKGDVPSAMIVKGDYKLIKFANGTHPMLFDMKRDRDEKENLGEEAGYASLVAKLLEELHSYWDEDHAQEKLEHMKRESSQLKEWIKATKPEIRGEWDAGKAENYILQESI